MGDAASLARWLLGRPLRVLFVGNSLTYFEAPGPGGALAVHDLPGRLARMSRDRNERRVLAPGRLCRDAACLEDHWDSGRLEAELAAGPWDTVVLQENSEQVCRDADAARRCVRRLHARIRAAGAQTVLFSPWAAAKAPDAGRDSEALFLELARELGTPLAPVGQAWRQAARERPDLELRLPDGLHAAPLGGYLAACVLYGCLYARSPEPPAASEDAQAFLHGLSRRAALAEQPAIQGAVAGSDR